MPGISAERTLGQSPKVIWPGLAIGGLGVLLVILGEIMDSARVRAAGLGALSSSALVAALGYAAPPGAVVPPDHDVADSHEHDTTRRVTQYEPPAEMTGEPTPPVRPGSSVS
jgi:hypothetical protein